MNNKVSFKISNNQDWADMKESESLVDISNDSYFGFRAMQKNAKQIIYDPSLISDLIRICKESKKFPNTKHILLLDSNTLNFEANKNIEEFIKSSSQIIENVLNINPLLVFDFELKIKKDWELESKLILNKIYGIK